jgi:hypothetical protein
VAATERIAPTMKMSEVAMMDALRPKISIEG